MKQKTFETKACSFKKNALNQEDQKIKARKEGMDTINWLGMMGIIGWSVTIPLVTGIALGVWIDKYYKSRYSFTLMLLFGGLALGCWIAWYWINKNISHSGNIENRNSRVDKKGD